MNILALDFGLKRIGVAFGDTTTGMVFPREAIMNDDQCFQAIGAILKASNIKKILVGEPKRRDGAAGDIVEELRQFVDAIRSRFHIPIELVDERYTSKIATQKLQHAGFSVKAGRQLHDSVAAQVILQDWIEKYGIRNT